VREVGRQRAGGGHALETVGGACIDRADQKTDNIVHYVVNTNFHWDHEQGSQAYASSWPVGIEIISCEATRNNIQ
jgi:glyoxylase-like metal-dependent hydrolase (beta-lactamase superfamily II)